MFEGTPSLMTPPCNGIRLAGGKVRIFNVRAKYSVVYLYKDFWQIDKVVILNDNHKCFIVHIFKIIVFLHTEINSTFTYVNRLGN